MTRIEKDKAIKKVQIAINKMIDLQDMGLGTGDIQRILDALWSLECSFNNS